MNIDFVFKIAAIGIIVAVLNQLLIRSGREEQAMMTTLAGLIVVLMMIISQISVLFDTIKVPEWVTGEQLKALNDFRITVVAEAIQAGSFANADKAWEAFAPQP